MVLRALRQKADRLIVKPDGIFERLFEKGQGKTRDIINVIMFADKYAGPSTKKFSEVFRRLPMEDLLYELWYFVRREIRYVKDEDGHEKIKSPSQTWKDRFADCKSMSIFIGSVLKNLGIPYYYRFVSWDYGEDYRHVYVIARPPEGEYILDAVHDEFDEEEKFARKEDIKGMTAISYIHGMKKRGVSGLGSTSLVNVLEAPLDPFRIDDSPKEVSARRYFNYTLMSEGQFELSLLDRKLEILQKFYGDPSGEYTKARGLILRAMSGDGLHRFSSFTGSIPTSLNSVATKVIAAKRKIAPAVKTPASIGTLIDKEDCRRKYSVMVMDYDGKMYPEIPPENSAAYNECARLQRWSDLLNSSYEQSAHHVLYEFITNPNEQPNVVTTKSVLHKTAISELSSITGISRTNFRNWTEVGVMWHNSTEKALGPKDPLATIELLRLAGQDPKLPRVGFLDPVTISGIVALVSILIKAFNAVSAHILKNKEIKLKANIRGFGTPEFSADTTDFNRNGIPDAQEGSSGLPQFFQGSAFPLLLLGGGALFMLNSK